jgi:hypothetical protein
MVIMLYFTINNTALGTNYPALTTQQEQWLGEQIFNNECARQINCLTTWNAGEAFPSLGIGHFIWYRENQNEIYQESFPDLIEYFKEQNISIPTWIEQSNHASPWRDRDEFMADFSGEELSELRLLLTETFPEQTSFIINRFKTALSKIQSILSDDESSIIEEKFYAIANAHPPYGLYALIDYINFKGEGVSPDEQYKSQGWGLLQVLAGTPDNSDNIIEDFVSSAKAVLQNRINNAPQQRNEEQWLPGWFNRLDTYLPSQSASDF